MLVAYVIVGFAVTVTVNELLIQSLTLKNFYTCRLARLISPVGSSWIYCKRFLPDFFASWFWKSRKTASHILANTVSWSCEPSVSWFAVYRMCVTKKVTHFSEVFDWFWCSNDEQISSGACGRFSLVANLFYALSLLFGPCRLSEFTLAGPLQWVPIIWH